ncbi:MAG: STAS domain-containing protein [Deltaproteobacteria bacterium]|nr:STAS domain-containing protein [Deltaproteobacteria bacterium]MBK8239647.1 STAS domain-containing protein [Deltaproteobacteria bacterium]MBP7289139.1 STAS domain-containing protein [Nannocystaceae bacterium]
MKAPRSVQIDASRIDRLLGALACVSVDRFDDPDSHVTPAAEDEFGLLEGAFQIFIGELAEAKAAAQRAIEQQRMTISALSTPIIDVWEGVVTLPLVGVIDTQRAVEMTERLLARIVESGARAVIIDLTGVEVVDTATADHLVRLTRAAGLLGARCFVTGIGPNIARTLVGMGVDLGGVRTMRTLKEALRACIDEGAAAPR